MKNIIRAFVFGLVITGAVASTHTASASTQNVIVATRTSAMPVPACPPSDPGDCGMGQSSMAGH